MNAFFPHVEAVCPLRLIEQQQQKKSCMAQIKPTLEVDVFSSYVAFLSAT